ncbi:dTDP-4-dehydrorhamnose reductase [Portibacter marinus]|uniref:dTDP-4-dehydrorhamnose reductase n=1 Tax=Portibacter marinus TaxID=2898660 RepID=UPI001F1F586A|nr:dTDP-4-dehydrorhamnose reductase [Portibacter marinus]
MNSVKKVLVTGANGQLGSELRKLGLDGYTFADKKELDLCSIKSMEQYFKDQSFNVIVNCAAYTAVDLAEKEKDKCFNVNVKAVRNLALLAKKQNCKLIHLSSDYVYHPDHNVPLHESDPCHPKGVYALSKRAGEKAIFDVFENAIVLRVSWLYSTFGNNFVKTMLRLGAERTKLNIVDDQIGSPTNAADLAKVITEIIKQDKGQGIYNYSNLGFISWADFAEAIFQLSGMHIQINRIPSTAYPTPAPRPNNSRLIKSKIADEFNLELNHWHKSLQKCLKEINN